MYLALKTDSFTSALVLLSNEGRVVAERRWESGRTLSDTLLTDMATLLAANNLAWEDLAGLIVFLGPGSFTSLRIGATVANTAAYVKKLPIVGAKGEDWARDGVKRLQQGHNDTQVVPEYGAAPNITKPRK
jgi:tRNA threonylcarbamoyladenosine biosynthesis protein TsaB